MNAENLLEWLDETERRVRAHIADFQADLDAISAIRALVPPKESENPCAAPLKDMLKGWREEATFPENKPVTTTADPGEARQANEASADTQPPARRKRNSLWLEWRGHAERWLETRGTAEFKSDDLIIFLQAATDATRNDIKAFVWNHLLNLVTDGKIHKTGTRKNFIYQQVTLITKERLKEIPHEERDEDKAIQKPEQRYDESEGESRCSECDGQCGTHKLGCSEPMPSTEPPAPVDDDLTRREGESVADFYARKRGLFAQKPKKDIYA